MKKRSVKSVLIRVIRGKGFAFGFASSQQPAASS
jgi:hypothetical protein